MRLQKITAVAHPAGNRIDLTWSIPIPSSFRACASCVAKARIRPRRSRLAQRQGIVVADTNPTSPDEGKVEVGEDGLYRATDTNLQGETVYYYALFPYAGDSDPVYQRSRHNRVTGYGYGSVCDGRTDGRPAADTLPPLRYGPPQADAVAKPTATRGNCAAFSDCPVASSTNSYSFARAMLDLHNLDKVDGALLPLLAQWIGWQTDFRLDIAAQRRKSATPRTCIRASDSFPLSRRPSSARLGWRAGPKSSSTTCFAPTSRSV